MLSSIVWYRLTTGHLGDIASRLLSVAELGRTNFSFELVYELVPSVRDLDLAAPLRAWRSRASCGRTIGRRRPA